MPCVDWNDESSGQIQTPGYPNGYPADTSCVYVFEKPGPEFCGIFLYTSKFDLEPQDSSGTCHDYLVHPGCTKSCGRRTSPSRYFFEYQPGSNILQLQFRSDFIDSGRGFLIDFYQVSVCSMFIHGVIFSNFGTKALGTSYSETTNLLGF